MRRTRLFRASEGSDAPAAQVPADAQPAADVKRAVTPVADEFKKAFEDLGVRPVGLNKLSRVSIVSCGAE
jgi:hypothetical protein